MCNAYTLTSNVVELTAFIKKVFFFSINWLWYKYSKYTLTPDPNIIYTDKKDLENNHEWLQVCKHVVCPFYFMLL